MSSILYCLREQLRVIVIRNSSHRKIFISHFHKILSLSVGYEIKLSEKGDNSSPISINLTRFDKGDNWNKIPAELSFLVKM